MIGIDFRISFLKPGRNDQAFFYGVRFDLSDFPAGLLQKLEC
ncbi:hypothetical protein SynPROSU1_01915 [Synechococcus sp. PROS-U-1]|nr:hypothetical protein SynPROSU1_01915 [Synechococcus sp. PROS-U-1]